VFQLIRLIHGILIP